MKAQLDDLGYGLLAGLRLELIGHAAAANASAMPVSLPYTTFQRWAEDVSIAIGLPEPALPVDAVDPVAAK